jgi:hypothetical protein
MKESLFNALVDQSGTLTAQDILMNFLVALVIGIVIFISYRFSHSGAVYSARFNISLLMLTIVTTLVMNVIGNNIALSLGMVGALSIVRFRTAIKDPRDSIYIFWCIAVGICCGVTEYLIPAIGSAIIFLLLLVMGAVASNDRYLLIIHSTHDGEDAVEEVVLHYYRGAAILRVKNSNRKQVEYIYQISSQLIKRTQNKNMTISDELYAIEGVQQVNLVCQNDEINR